MIRGQNLVLNPHMESGGNCFLGAGFNPNVCSSWDSSNGLYFNACATGSLEYSTPANAAGYQMPHSGAGYSGFFCGGVGPQYSDTTYIMSGRQYIEGVLSSPLISGQLYCVSYYISLADTSTLAQQRIGVYFSNTLISSHGPPLPYSPQLVTPTGLYFTDKQNWTQISAIYQAAGGEQFLTIGNFDASFNLIHVAPYYDGNISGNMAYYYLDDVSVVPVSSVFAHPLGADTILCDTVGFSKILSVSSLMYDSILWSTGATSNQITVTHTGTYTVDCYSGDCHVRDSIRISYHAPYDFKTYTDTSICADRLPLKIGGQTGFTNYSWSSGDTNSEISVSAAGLYTVSFNTVCGPKSDSFDVHTIPVPLPPAITTDTVLCNNKTILPLSAIGTDLLWYHSATDTQPSASAPIPDRQNFNAQTFYVSQTVNGCESPKAASTIHMTSPPLLDLGQDQTHCRDITIEIGSAALPMTNYRWNTGDTSSVIKIDTSGLYICQAMNFCGSAYSDIHIAYIDCDSDCLYVPNAFTPNGDGVNDLFEIFPRCPFIYFQLQVFNRWGERVFETNDITNGWNGSFRGVIQPPGIYVYHLYMTNESGETEQKKGSITLIR